MIQNQSGRIYGHLKDEESKQSESKTGAWVVTFADLMTLLFCFFVLLTSLSTAPKNCNGLAAYLEENRALYQNLELRGSKLECVITLPSDFLFRTGQDQMQAEALSRLRPLFRNIIELEEHRDDLVIVEGHTDDIPIRSRRFPSNWELSSARATNVASFMGEIGVPQARLSVRAFAEYRPRVDYRDDYGGALAGRDLSAARRANRRVEIILADAPKGLEEYSVLFR